LILSWLVGVFVLPVFPALPLVGVSPCVLREATAATGDLAKDAAVSTTMVVAVVGIDANGWGAPG